MKVYFVKMSISIDERGKDPPMGSVNHDIQLKKIVLGGDF